VSWGGLLGLPLAIAALARLSGFPALVCLDALARIAPVGHALGRLGCLTYGCCFGRPTASGLSITYRNPLAKAVRVGGLGGVPLHPAPLYEAALDLVIFAAVNAAVLPPALPQPLGECLLGALEDLAEFLGRVARGGAKRPPVDWPIARSIDRYEGARAWRSSPSTR
jgi:hypothetical protein